MKKLFENHNIAIELKKLGFNESCLATFESNGRITGCDYIDAQNLKGIKNSELSNNHRKGFCVVPLYQQVISWFEKEHKIYIGILPYRDEDTELCWYYTLVEDSEELYPIMMNDADLNASGNYDTSEEARDAAIQNAIEIVKERLDLKK